MNSLSLQVQWVWRYRASMLEITQPTIHPTAPITLIHYSQEDVSVKWGGVEGEMLYPESNTTEDRIN